MNIKNLTLKFSLFLILKLLVLTGFSQKSDSQMIIDSLYSSYLNESRAYCLYLPPDFDNQKKYPIIYCADGQVIVEVNYKPLLDSLISANVINPIILIGLYSSERPAPGVNITYRYIEYVKHKGKSNQQIFENHLRFFIDEAPKYILNKYNIQEDNSNATFYGCSNGGGFGMTLFLHGGHQYQNFLCYSPLGSAKVLKKQKKDYPNLYISYGTEEFFVAMEEFSNLTLQLKQKGYDFLSEPYIGGHDRFEWKKEFCRTISKIYSTELKK